MVDEGKLSGKSWSRRKSSIMYGEIRDSSQCPKVNILPVRGLLVMGQRNNTGSKISDLVNLAVGQKPSAHFGEI